MRPPGLPFALFLLLSPVFGAKTVPSKILLSNVKSLTLRADAKTSHRRVPAVPQLECIGGSAAGLYEVDVLRCRNQGADYDEESVQWTCTADLPPEFKLGSTDVACEGYDGAGDRYVLKGSCGVAYSLVLTDAGEERYGRRRRRPEHDSDGGPGRRSGGGGAVPVLFWVLFAAVVLWMLYSALFRSAPNDGRRPGATNGFGPGGGGGPPYDDPPPPYDDDYAKPSHGMQPNARPGFGIGRFAWPRNVGFGGAPHEPGRRPGFWTGAAAGGAAAYAAASYAARPQRGGSSSNGGNGSNGEGSSRSGSGAGGGYSSMRYESSGFGGTSRR